MHYDEFDKYESLIDSENKLVHFYQDELGNRFYVEPGFYSGLMGFKEKRAERFDEIMASIDATIKKEHKVIFTADFENPWITREGFIYREILDITDPLQIFVEDKSRGSDYGD
ncbi:MAG: hypothetical protein K6F32_06095 [Bacilli bacterium]|nr:hypothetical protein [Bacilli bacterium]